jgi:hypothetical protein
MDDCFHDSVGLGLNQWMLIFVGLFVGVCNFTAGSAVSGNFRHNTAADSLVSRQENSRMGGAARNIFEKMNFFCAHGEAGLVSSCKFLDSSV